MADNRDLAALTGLVTTDEATYSGDTAHIQLVRNVHVTGTEGSKTVSEIWVAEDAAHASGQFGLQVLTVRQDTAAALAGTNADYQPLITDDAGRLHVNAGNDITQTASLTTSTTNTLTIGDGFSAVNLRISNTWVGTIAFEASIDGSVWDPVYGLRSGEPAAYISVTEALNNNIFRFSLAGYSQVRVNFTRTSGTLDLFWRASYSTSAVDQASPAPAQGRNTFRIAAQSAGLTTATTAYSAGDQVGTQFTLANAARVSGGTGRIKSVLLTSAADIIGGYDVIFTRASITLAADNAAYAISDADIRSAVQLVPLGVAYDIGNNRMTGAYNLDIPYDCSGGTSLFAGLITRTAHTFFGATTDLELVVFVERD